MRLHSIIEVARTVVFAFPIILFFQCSADKEQQVRLATYPVVRPEVRDTVVAVDYIAGIESVRFVEIRARVSGYLEKIHVDEGQLVKQGQLLFTLTSREYREELAKATAVLRNAIAEARSAELDLRNTQTLVDRSVVSTAELELARVKLEAANARVSEAQAHESSAALRLSYTEVRAPFDGLLDRFPSKAGSLIDEGELLTSISDTREVFAYFNFSEQEYLDYALEADAHAWADVKLILANNTSFRHAGRIETVEGKVDRKTGSIALRARFPNPEGLVRHGSSGKVRIERPIGKAMLIPQKATFEIQDNNFVYVLGKDSIVEMRSFVPKYRIDEFYIVESGISPSDEIVYEGIQRLREGDKIQGLPVVRAEISKGQ